MEQKTVTIGETEYLLEQFDGSQGLFWFATLGQLASGAMLGFESFPKAGLLEQQIHFGNAIRGLITHLKPEEFATLSKRMYRDCVATPEYEHGDFDRRFAGARGLNDLLTLMRHIIEFNMGDLVPTLKKTVEAVTGLRFLDSTASDDESTHSSSES